MNTITNEMTGSTLELGNRGNYIMKTKYPSLKKDFINFIEILKEKGFKKYETSNSLTSSKYLVFFNDKYEITARFSNHTQVFYQKYDTVKYTVISQDESTIELEILSHEDFLTVLNNIQWN